TTDEILNEHEEDEIYDGDEQQQRVYYEDDDIQNYHEEEETHQDLYHTVASSSTAKSSSHTLRDEGLATPRPNKHGISTNSKPSDRYTFSFSADLIDQV